METHTDPADRFVTVTEIAQDDVAPEQVNRLCQRYYWAGPYCENKDVVEVACGTGQGLGYLGRVAKSVVGGDISPAILNQARAHYGDRFPLLQFSADQMPFEDNSKDVIIIFEALYYLPDVPAFVRECRRVLRSGGWILIATANKDLYDFNPSPFSHQYYGVKEMAELFEGEGFSTRFFGNTPVTSVSLRQRILRPIKKVAVDWNLIPQTTGGKKWLKKVVFGGLVPMPPEVEPETAPQEEAQPILPDKADTLHKVIFCAARLETSNA